MVNIMPHLVDNSKMLEVRAIIEQYCEGELLCEPLPSIKKLADSVLLNESTLKHHFKAFFGKSVYELYLCRKMQVAGEKMLDNPGISVGKLSKDLGYKKVSNFITVFANFYGYTPGKIELSSILLKLKNIL